MRRLGTFGVIGFWESASDLERFRASQLGRRWAGAEEHLELTLSPMRSIGAWNGVDPLAGIATETTEGPTLVVTHSRTPVLKTPAFMATSRRVAAGMPNADGYIWSEGFIDGVATFNTGTLSLWRDATAAVAFAHDRAGLHGEAMRKGAAAGWFRESWFARFTVSAASGSWGQLDSVDIPSCLNWAVDGFSRGEEP